MAMEEAAFERHYSVEELTELWGMSDDFLRRLFLREPRVVVFWRQQPRKRVYRALRIPASWRCECTAACPGSMETLMIRRLINTSGRRRSNQRLTRIATLIGAHVLHPWPFRTSEQSRIKIHSRD
jgi:hypothetical protein